MEAQKYFSSRFHMRMKYFNRILDVAAEFASGDGDDCSELWKTDSVNSAGPSAAPT